MVRLFMILLFNKISTGCFIGPNGPVLKEVMDLHPNAPLIRRDGEVNAWDNADFRAAVKATGKKQVIIAGIITDVSRVAVKRDPTN